jgi:16S rRNA (guanine527-N7)-methyltransferase
MPDSIFRYFPSVSEDQKNKILLLKQLYVHWNSMINVISRKDMDNFYLHHVLHSLSIAKLISFAPGTSVLDVGTGGGFPGIPLAIIFTESKFTLLDSIEKKIKVVRAVADNLGLKNVRPVRCRAEEEKAMYDFVISRAVTDFPGFVSLTSKNISPVSRNNLANGIIYLKGGDIDNEIAPFSHKLIIRYIADFFTEPFFESKKIIYLPL